MKRVITFFLTLLMIYHPGIFAGTRSPDAPGERLQQAQAQVNAAENARIKSSARVDEIEAQISIIEARLQGAKLEGVPFEDLREERRKLREKLSRLRKDLKSAQEGLETQAGIVAEGREALVVTIRRRSYRSQPAMTHIISKKKDDKSEKKNGNLITSQEGNTDAKVLSAQANPPTKPPTQPEIEFQDAVSQEISQADLFLANINVLQTRLKIDRLAMDVIEKGVQSHLELSIMGKYLRTNLEKMSHDIASTLCMSARACLKDDNIFGQRMKKIIEATIKPNEEKATIAK